MEAIAREIDLYRQSFSAIDQARGRQPEWLRKVRRDAFARFQELGLPTARLESWKHTNPRAIAETSWSPAAGTPAGDFSEEETLRPWRIPGAIELVFLNGRFSRQHSRPGAAQDGVHVASLAQRLLEESDSAKRCLADFASPGAAAFPSWNMAFFEDGALVEIGPGAIVRAPIHLLFATVEEEAPAVSSPRNLVISGARSQASVVETYVGAGAARSLTNSVTEVALGEGSILDHSKLQRESLTAFHVHSIAVRQQRGSNFTSHNLAFGSALARTDIGVVLEGEGAECALDGLFIGGGAQILDNHTVIDHATTHGTSREMYKGILDGESRGVFHGRIVVRPGAQKTDAVQTNRNLLLSSRALVNSTPALEILADDVRCRHGSTTGQLDEAAQFYLRSRGLDQREARAMLTRAFAAEVTGRISVEPLRTSVEDFLGDRLSGGSS